jgi:hypothetical protein
MDIVYKETQNSAIALKEYSFMQTVVTAEQFQKIIDDKSIIEKKELMRFQVQMSELEFLYKNMRDMIKSQIEKGEYNNG